MKVKEIMKNNVVWQKPHATIGQVNEKMREKGIRSCVICNKDMEILGIVTDSDIVLRGIGAGKDENARIEDVMTSNPVTIKGDEDIIEAVYIMRQKKFRRMPVVDGNKLIGIISITDLAPYMISYFRKARGS